MAEKKQVVILVGLPLSGKSFIAENYQKHGYVVLSSDAIRTELGDINDTQHNDKVFGILRNRLYINLIKKNNIVIDATNINIKSRKGFLQIINNKNVDRDNYNIIAYVLTTPYDICLSRNKKRSRVVPEEAIKKFVHRFEIPFYEEGFDNIILGTYETWDNVFFKAPTLSEVYHYSLDEMKNFNQKTHYHKYTLDKHCYLTFENLYKNNIRKPSLLRAALVHDIGKKFTQKLKANGKDYCYYGHQNVGTYYLLSNLSKVSMDNKNDTLDMLFYVNYHMLPFFLHTDKSKDKWRKIFGEEKYNDLLLFNKYDIIASGRDENGEEKYDKELS